MSDYPKGIDAFLEQQRAAAYYERHERPRPEPIVTLTVRVHDVRSMSDLDIVVQEIEALGHEVTVREESR